MDEQVHNNLERALGRLEGKLDGMVNIVNTVSNDVSSLRNDFGTMEKGRLTALEVKFASMSSESKAKAKISGFWGGAAVSLIISVLGEIILYALLHK